MSARRGLPVEAVLRRGDPFGDETADRVSRPIDPDRDVDLELLSDRLQHEVGRVLTSGWTPDADPNV